MSPRNRIIKEFMELSRDRYFGEWQTRRYRGHSRRRSRRFKQPTLEDLAPPRDRRSERRRQNRKLKLSKYLNQETREEKSKRGTSLKYLSYMLVGVGALILSVLATQGFRVNIQVQMPMLLPYAGLATLLTTVGFLIHLCLKRGGRW